MLRGRQPVCMFSASLGPCTCLPLVSATGNRSGLRACALYVAGCQPVYEKSASVEGHVCCLVLGCTVCPEGWEWAGRCVTACSQTTALRGAGKEEGAVRDWKKSQIPWRMC